MLPTRRYKTATYPRRFAMERTKGHKIGTVDLPDAGARRALLRLYQGSLELGGQPKAGG